MRWQISIADELAEQIDEYSKANFMSRSGFISFATHQFLQSSQAISALDKMSVALERIAKIGEIDEQAKTELEDITRAVKMISGS